MTTYERNIIKEIYPKACAGNRWAIKVLANLTTKRRAAPKCRRKGCKNPVATSSRRECPKFCSQLCHQIARRTTGTIHAVLI